MRANFTNILNLLSSSNATLTAIVVSETWLSSHNEDIFQIDGYNFYSNCSKIDKPAGGIYISEYLDCSIRDDLTVSNEYNEYILLRFCGMVKEIFLSAAYIDPTLWRCSVIHRSVLTNCL